METFKLRVNGLNRLMKWSLLCGLLSLALAHPAPATIPLYDNESVLSYTIPPDIFPTIDASNFLNNSSFSINFENLTINTELFQTWNTINYTNSNTGVLSANNGFQFDTQTTNVIPDQMAGSFYNSGQIFCASINNTNTVLLLEAGQLIVWATNIVDSGLVDVGEGGLVQFTGQNVDLSRSQFTIEGTPAATASGGTFATNNTAMWSPSVDLTANYAYSSPAAILDLVNSTPYFDIRTNFATGTNVIIRAVFIEPNIGSNVTDQVYIDANVNVGNLLGAGAADVQWIGTYVDPVTGVMATNYINLNDDYVAGSITNALGAQFLATGIPDNFTVTTATTPLIVGTPNAPGFPAGFAFNAGAVSNTYAYAEVQFPASTVATNSPSQNVSNYLAILPGRIQITASQSLTMGLAQISGPNYLSITATNQFNGSIGAQIASPYSDLSLGATNGSLTVSNLLEPAVVVWNGAIQAWSARWFNVDTNSGATNDYRVLLVSSQLTPTTPTYVQNLNLYATNNLVIADTLNIIGSFWTDAQNLTLTTNASNPVSVDGQLNLQTSSVVWASSTPDLLNLTNNGVIQLQNLGVFGSAPPANYLSLINNGLISDAGSQIWANNFVNGGTFTSGAQSFTLQSLATTLTNGSITAGGNISLTTGSLLASNVLLSAGQALTIAATNSLTDTGVTNGNLWSVSGGLNLLVKPLSGALLGTTITNIAPDDKNVNNTWAGADFGYSTAGYSNNAAIGRLILDAAVTNSAHKAPYTQFTFTGAGVSNAIYVDYLELDGDATNRPNGAVSSLSFNPNLVIYYAQAVANGISVAEKIDHFNNDHLRWLPAYIGYYSSTNIVYTNIVNGVTNLSTNTFNSALAQSSTYDSDGDGIVNAIDPTPFFVAGEVNFKLTLTNLPPASALISWQTIPGATNYVYYKTNLLAGAWQPLTNFLTPAPYPSPLTTVSVSDPVGLTGPRFYQVRVVPSTVPPYGPGP